MGRQVGLRSWVGSPGFSAGQWNGLAIPVGRGLLWVGARRGRPTPSGHRRNFTHDSMVVSLWFGAEKMHFPVRKRSVPLSSGGTNRLQGVLGLPATASSLPLPRSPPQVGELCFPLKLTLWGCTPHLPGGHSCGAQETGKLVLSSSLFLPPSSPGGSSGRDLSPQDSKCYQWIKVLSQRVGITWESIRNTQPTDHPQKYWVMFCVNFWEVWSTPCSDLLHEPLILHLPFRVCIMKKGPSKHLFLCVCGGPEESNLFD